MRLGISVPGRRRKVTTREPGDLPSYVVTREDAGRGVQALASLGWGTAGGDFVRCDVPLTSYRGPTMHSFVKTSARRRFWLASAVLIPLSPLAIPAAHAQQSASPDLLPP